MPFTDWRQVFVGCSGSFRFDRAARDMHSTVTVHLIDVSLLSCSLGALATGGEFPIAFKDRLAFIEDMIAGQPFMARVAAVEVALEMAKYKGANSHAQAHFAHYEERFVEFLAWVWKRLEAFLKGLHIARFHPRGFRKQARRAAEVGVAVAAFPPTYKNGYERLYRFVDEFAD